MRDVFYTILVVWLIWRIFNSISSYNQTKQKGASGNPSSFNPPKEGKTSVDHVPPVKKRIRDDEGEYVDFEEIK